MALQGTLDTFELPDVLRLLASTKKTGRLHLESDRGHGAVWLQDGDVVAVESPTSVGDIDEGLFDLLRSREGGFAFDPGVTTESAGSPTAVEPLLATTEARLVEWREIEAVVPSMHAWVALAAELPGPEVTVDSATWRLVATIGSGLTVHDLAAALDLAEVPVCRLVRDLVTLGLGVVIDAPAQTWDPVGAAEGYDVLDDAGLAETTGEAAESSAYGDSYGDAAVDELAPSTDEGSAAWQPEPGPGPDLLTRFQEPTAEPDVDDEVARQLAMLSPRAAQAVVAAVAAEAPSEHGGRGEPVAPGEEPVNRGLLLNFLNSVKS